VNLGSLFTTIGESGNQFADAKMLAYQTRIQKLLDDLALKQGDLSLKKGALGLEEGQASLDEIKERTRRLKLQPETDDAKFKQTLATFRSVFNREPTDQEKSVLFGLPAPQQEKITNEFEGWRAAFKERMGRFPTDQEIEAHHREEGTQKKIEVKTTAGTGMPYEITDANGKSWRVSDPNMPPELQAQVKDYVQAHVAGLKQQEIIEARKNAEALNRALQIGDQRELLKQRDEVFKTAKRGIAGHSFLKTVAQEVNQAEMTGGKGTTAGDMMIVEGFMQLMFGVDPKALRGSPKMMEVLLKQGGWDDRAIASMNSVMTGGKLSQDVRKQILDGATRQVSSWDQAVTASGALVDDKQTKALVDRYMQHIGQGEDDAIKALGGKPH